MDRDDTNVLMGMCVLQAVNDAAANPQSESMPCIGMGAEYPQLMEVAERLNDNVAQLHRSICLFMGQAWKKASSHLIIISIYTAVCVSFVTAGWCSMGSQCWEEQGHFAHPRHSSILQGRVTTCLQGILGLL